ncbi:Uu.00g098640.m01.CDS01 [Anthostomella pinea]|uniref:Uu.00g098640.m01.CDS01 n=1 Tax=Anthostomella pinea TaxID=933095 RepID=A0AAI8YF51_9PEZI|nr:Uu.00g098640.m01.CDS01 [Anthostomella pinea]
MASFNGVMHNLDSPHITRRPLAIQQGGHEENEDENLRSTQSSEIPDSMPRNTVAIAEFSSPTRLLEHYLGQFESPSEFHIAASDEPIEAGSQSLASTNLRRGSPSGSISHLNTSVSCPENIVPCTPPPCKRRKARHERSDQIDRCRNKGPELSSFLSIIEETPEIITETIIPQCSNSNLSTVEETLAIINETLIAESSVGNESTVVETPATISDSIIPESSYSPLHAHPVGQDNEDKRQGHQQSDIAPKTHIPDLSSYDRVVVVDFLPQHVYTYESLRVFAPTHQSVARKTPHQIPKQPSSRLCSRS